MLKSTGSSKSAQVEELLVSFANESRAKGKALADEISAPRTTPLVYNFADEAGLKGILVTGRFRMSDIFDLNDPSELRRRIFTHSGSRESRPGYANIHPPRGDNPVS